MDVEREKRWSMNSQRLEEIVAELMKPISDIRRNFDTDLSALLEEYLTEAGLRALEQGEGYGGEEVAPNFTEIALLLQQSAHIYSRKVDCLYQDVLRVTDALNNSTLEENVGGGEAVVSGAVRTPKRRVSAAAAGDFEAIRLERSAAARREAPLRPPPTLPRVYIELEPRPLAPTDTQIIDYAAEPIGLLADFHVFWTLKDGLLLEELEESRGSDGARPPLTAPPPSPSPPPPLTLPQLSVPSPPPSPLLPPSPFNCSTPLPPPLKRERKRRIAIAVGTNPAAKLLISEEVLRALRGEHGLFGLSPQWIRRVVETSSGQVLPCSRAPSPPFRGWDAASIDIGGFCGWPEEAARSAWDAALGEAQHLRLRPVEESDDDGFFEQSSSSDGEPRRSPEPSTSDWRRWRESVLARASDSAPDIRHTAALLLRSTPAAPAPPMPFTALLRHHHAAHRTPPAHLTLAALFLANSGNIEIVEGEPLSINSFSVRLLSADEALYQPAMARDPPS